MLYYDSTYELQMLTNVKPQENSRCGFRLRSTQLF